MLKAPLQNRTFRIALYAAGIVAIVLFMWLTAPKPAAPPTANGEETPAAPGPAPEPAAPPAPENKPTGTAPKKNTNTKTTGFTEKRTPHFVSATIANNATLASMPTTLTITFDAAVTKSTESFITVKRDQITSATSGSSYIGGDGKTLSVNLNPQVANGDYYVYYVACFADTGCADGRFGFRLKKP